MRPPLDADRQPAERLGLHRDPAGLYQLAEAQAKVGRRQSQFAAKLLERPGEDLAVGERLQNSSLADDPLGCRVFRRDSIGSYDGAFQPGGS